MKALLAVSATDADLQKYALTVREALTQAKLIVRQHIRDKNTLLIRSIADSGSQQVTLVKATDTGLVLRIRSKTVTTDGFSKRAILKATRSAFALARGVSREFILALSTKKESK